ncbi:MAG: SDR family NAD(P)-dependent oxidoreductase [Gammaproteobacteria bacterium]
MSHYLVTGGAGFIGTHLVKALIAAGHHVHVLDNLSNSNSAHLPLGAAQCTFTKGDVTDENLVNRLMAKQDGCFHLAAIASVEQSHKDWLGTHHTNLTGTITVFNAARPRKTPVVYASSAAVYGDQSIPLTEKNPPQPLSAYGADKLACEYHGVVASHNHGVPTTGLRLFNVYGPGQNPHSPYSGVISIFMSHLQQNHPLPMKGDGTQTRDFIYIDDVVQSFLLAMKQCTNSPELYNICTGQNTSILSLGQTLSKLYHQPLQWTHQPSTTADTHYSLGVPTHAQKKLDFTATYSLAAGLEAWKKYLDG